MAAAAAAATVAVRLAVVAATVVVVVLPTPVRCVETQGETVAVPYDGNAMPG